MDETIQMNILMDSNVGGHRTGDLPETLTVEQIVAVLGEPNVRDDPYKVTHSWGFTIDGEPAAIWDYKGDRWSTFGPNDKIRQLFGL